MTLWTIGTEKRTPVEIAIALQTAGVERLVDVRWGNSGQYDPNRRTSLEPVIVECGLEYVAIPGLGVPSVVRKTTAKSFNPEQAWAVLKDWYRATLRGENAGYVDAGHLVAVKTALESVLVALRRGDAMALLCYERRPEDCHRLLLAEHLVGMEGELKVVHL